MTAERRNTSDIPDLILASESPRRQELLRLLGLEFHVVASDFDESGLSEWPPEQHVLRSAAGKAINVATRIDNGVVIGADTIVSVDKLILGKPDGPEDAARMLRLLSDRSHYVFSGLCVAKRVNARTVRTLRDFERTEVRFGKLTDEIINAYIATGEPLDKAGAYGIQERGSVLVQGIVGDYFNVVGLPIYRLGQMLQKAGIAIFGQPALDE